MNIVKHQRFYELFGEVLTLIVLALNLWRYQIEIMAFRHTVTGSISYFWIMDCISQLRDMLEINIKKSCSSGIFIYKYFHRFVKKM